MPAPEPAYKQHLEFLLAAQDGVIARRQLLACGVPVSYARTRLRRREWVRTSAGVYLTHTGQPTWRQRAWMGVLAAERAVLSHQSALQAASSALPKCGPIHIAVGRKSRAPKVTGVVVHRYEALDERAVWSTCPPRMLVEHAALDVAESARTDFDALAGLAECVQARLTSARQLLAALAARRLYRRRKFIAAALVDIAEGTHSVLEHGYLTLVERPHGLPRPKRQAPTNAGRRGQRDTDYPEWGLVVELDGKLFHDNPRQRDSDLERDLDAAADLDRRTVRLSWAQVYDRPCITAQKVARILQRLGWPGKPTLCPKCAPRKP